MFWYIFVLCCFAYSALAAENAFNCSIPPLEHGSYVSMDANGNFIFEFTCDPGYTISGSRWALCAPSRNYITNLPKCVAVSLPIKPINCIPPPINHGKSVASVLNGLIQLDYTCDPGYKIKGLNSTICIRGFDLVFSAPECVEDSEPITEKQRDCILPPYPDNGRYAVAGAPDASPGQAFQTIIQLNFTCDSGYGVNGENIAYCVEGSWSLSTFPQCVRVCKLDKHASVEYRCVVTGDTTEGTRPCRSQEPSGTIVRPECRAPNYYFSSVLSNMRCTDGSWNYVAICNPECGRVTPEGQQLIIGGTSARKGELPWHAGIYSKSTTPYMQICGGSLVSTSVVISAAHCFWDNLEEKAQPASMFAVAVGKLYRPWNDPYDDDVQKSNVSEIKLPSRFQGAAANFQEDLAVVVLASTIEYRTHVRPVCISFDVNFDRRQLRHRNAGKVAGWGLTAENGVASQVLKVLDLPYVDVVDCIRRAPAGFKEYITSDKFCAGYQNGTAVCRGDSGGGLVFPSNDQGVERFYLRGVVSTSPSNDHLCNAFTLTAFTQVVKHEPFIKDFFYF